jgi:hypothetical protein
MSERMSEKERVGDTEKDTEREGKRHTHTESERHTKREREIICPISRARVRQYFKEEDQKNEKEIH